MSTRILPEFNLFLPHTINEAANMLSKYGEKASVMAAGTDLLVMMKDGYSKEYIIALSAVPDLNYVMYDSNKGLRIGAMATLVQVAASPVVREKYLK